MLDAHGYALSKFVGEGHYSPKHHNAMEDALADSTALSGYQRCTAAGPFTSTTPTTTGAEHSRRFRC